jgi:hypothetical protein
MALQKVKIGLILSFRTVDSVGLADSNRSLPGRLGPTLLGDFLSDSLQESPQKIGIADRQEVEGKPRSGKINFFYTPAFAGAADLVTTVGPPILAVR